MNPVKSNETLEVRINTLRLATPNVDTKLHKARRVQLVKLEVEPLQHSNNKRVRWKFQPSKEKLLINTNLIIMGIGNNLSL